MAAALQKGSRGRKLRIVHDTEDEVDDADSGLEPPRKMQVDQQGGSGETVLWEMPLGYIL